MDQFPIFIQTFFNHVKKRLSCLLYHFSQFITTDNNSVYFRNVLSHKLTLSVSYLHLIKSLKTEATSKEKFNSPIIYGNKFAKVSHTFSKIRKQILTKNRAKTCAIYLDYHLIKSNLIHRKNKLEKSCIHYLFLKKIVSLLHSSF